MTEDDVVVASYLIIGLTEEDLHYVTQQLQAYGRIFIEDDQEKLPYKIEMINDTAYPVIALKVNGSVWERFSRSHDMVEYSLVMAQDGILGELH